MKALFTLLFLGSLLASAHAAEPRKPNVVIILTDDQGFGELGATGNPVVHTPHIDHLAAQSASLTNYHVMPVCSVDARLPDDRALYLSHRRGRYFPRPLADVSG